MEFETQMSESIFKAKYLLPTDESIDSAVERVTSVVRKYYPHKADEVKKAIHERKLGIAGGLWRSANNPNTNVSAINCTTLDTPEDNLESIADGWYWWAKFAAVGQGEGIDLSKLRPRGSKLHNSANKSTGAVSFMHTFDGVLSTIAQQGRRGASLISLNIKHPDIPEFITVKDAPGVLETANISIHVTDDFMHAVENDEEWVFSYTNKYETVESKTSAKGLFKFLAEHAWKSGDPGVQFIDVARRHSNSDALGYTVVSTNACSEQYLDPHNVCLLSSIVIGRLNLEEIPYYTDLLVYTLDAFRMEEINMKRSPSPIQMEKLEKLPRIGIGVTGLADYFIQRKIKYDSDEAIKEADLLFKALAGQAYKTSYEIAKARGKSFEWYDKEKYKTSPFIQNLLKEGVIEDYHLDYQAHVCKTTVAPNGTLTEVVEAGGGGIEPIFAKYFVRRERATTGDWKEWFVFNHLVRHELEKIGVDVTKENVDKYLNEDYWVTAHTVDNKKKIKLMSTIQKYIDSAISVTYNLPEQATPQDIEEIYWEAWKNELKAVSVFREGCKPGVLITENNYEKTKNETEVPKVVDGRISPKRPEVLEADIHKMKVKGVDHIILVGLLEGKPYEVFVTHSQDIDFNKHTKGLIKKVKKGQYDLIIPNGEDKTYIKDIAKTFDSQYGTLSRILSLSLRHNVKLQFIVAQLAKDKEFAGFSRAASRALKHYIHEGEEVLESEKCEQCDSSSFVYQGGCKTCIHCGWSKCD